MEEVREIVRGMRADLWSDIEAGRLRLPIDRTFSLDQAAAALAHMRANAHFGKIVLTMWSLPAYAASVRHFAKKARSIMVQERKGPLSRFKVIDLTRARAGPTAARHFADWGADVIKVEMPIESRGRRPGWVAARPGFLQFASQQAQPALNLKTPEGVAILKKLAARPPTY